MGGLPAGVVFALTLVWAVLRVDAEEEGEKPSSMETAVAATMMGAITFQMGLFYFISNKDKDIRRYTYSVIAQTISIFCAVLLFQTCNSFIEAILLEGSSREYELVVNMCHMLVWYLILLASLAYISGAVGKEPEHVDKLKNNMKSIAVLLAHMTGFASINAWGSMQQLEFFRQSPLHSLLTLPISGLGMWTLQEIFGRLRMWISLSDDDKVDEFEELWAEETEECEDDVMGLTLSFSLTQSLRFAIGGALPNEEGIEEWETLGSHGRGRAMILVGCAGVWLIVSALLNRLYDSLRQRGSNASKKWRRRVEMMLTTSSMAFAWSCFFGWKWFFGSFDMMQNNTVLLAVILAMFFSISSFGTISILDKLADADWTGEKVDKTITDIISWIGILIGFAWEQCFDIAVTSLAALPDSPMAREALRVYLALFCVSVVFPAWKWWILPMVLENGWKYGFVIADHHDGKWDEVMNIINMKRASMVKKAADKSAGNGYVQLPDGPSPTREALNELRAGGSAALEAEVARLVKENLELKRAKEESEHEVHMMLRRFEVQLDIVQSAAAAARRRPQPNGGRPGPVTGAPDAAA